MKWLHRHLWLPLLIHTGLIGDLDRWEWRASFKWSTLQEATESAKRLREDIPHLEQELARVAVYEEKSRVRLEKNPDNGVQQIGYNFWSEDHEFLRGRLQECQEMLFRAEYVI
ncbi:unnamed protein product [Vitrella brassicaformis CCMP3155]|uniref:Uncharacterized protein n=1 Tax=Vitrella brassicaformis (strain CCMP3155) TaxID=1169540 RepID=A0A0G4FXV7_VITBC|nr:unnamed protein product [Vitrella brassicaformis CCMP3155]|eukprot:CEM20259.1 unnamed protein product [Vitrella brassicaformis CCMP3155]